MGWSAVSGRPKGLHYSNYRSNDAATRLRSPDVTRTVVAQRLYPSMSRPIVY